MTAEELDKALSRAANVGSVDTLRDVARAASKFLRSRLSEAAYSGECHHCDEVGPGEPCQWCGLVAETPGGPR
jgi:purine nucleoside permease